MIRDKLRRYRRYFSYPLIISPLLLASPTLVQTHPVLDASLDIAGLFIAFCGQALRLWAWGVNPRASGLRLFGPYSFIRHPLYMGNFLIALGLLLVFNVPHAYVIVLPSLAFLYWSVTTEEEERLEKKWGAAYESYRAKVPRFLPWRGRALNQQGQFAFDLKHALGKERESICGLAAGAMTLEAYEEILAQGLKEVRGEVLFFFVMSSVLGVLSLLLCRQRRKEKEKA